MASSSEGGSLAGTAALVTGGENGIGLACARRLAADGAVVTICGRPEQRLKLSADAHGLVAGIADPGPVLDDYLACLPLSRVGLPADIAEAARFLAGPESAWITGEVINVDGGQHLRRGPDYTAMFEPIFGAAALRGLPDDNAGRLLPQEGLQSCVC